VITLQPFIDHLRDLLARNELPATYEHLRILLDNKQKLNTVFIQLIRLQDIRKQGYLGVVSHDETDLTQN
jgi:hypothetical protein